MQLYLDSANPEEILTARSWGILDGVTTIADEAVASARELEFLAVSFRPRPPHFSVTFSLAETLKHPGGELEIFDSLRELAESSPTSRF